MAPKNAYGKCKNRLNISFSVHLSVRVGKSLVKINV